MNINLYIPNKERTAANKRWLMRNFNFVGSSTEKVKTTLFQNAQKAIAKMMRTKLLKNSVEFLTERRNFQLYNQYSILMAKVQKL